MKRTLYGLAIVGALALPACSALDRQNMTDLLGQYAGATPTSQNADGSQNYLMSGVAKKVALDVISKGGDPLGIIMYIGGAIGVVLSGWLGGKYLIKKTVTTAQVAESQGEVDATEKGKE
jgi:hypothetical protein